MKVLFRSLIVFIAAGMGFNSFGQCVVTANPTTVSTICGEPADLVAQGVSSGPVLAEDFNAETLGPGWAASQTVMYNNPCGPSLDGSPSAWMGSAATQPRTLTTIPFDLQCGAVICFDFDMAEDENSTDCEDPDAANEGVHFAYSTDGGTTWTDIFYFQPNSANTGPYYQWANYCFDLPPGGWSANTMFQWDQPFGSSAFWDHWGIDNVTIQPYDCGNNYYYEWNGQLGDSDTTVYPTVTTVYDIIFTNGIDDTCNTQVTVNVDPFNVDVTANPGTNLNCGDCTDLLAELNPMPSIPGANYTYTWTPTTDLSADNVQDPTACPTDDITYAATITETNSGCTAFNTIDITVAGGGAIADFSVFPGLSGCAPFAVDFTNNSTGQSYEWDFGDGSPIDTSTDPSHVFTTQGTYEVMLVSYLPGAGCINYDTAYVTIEVGSNIVPTADFAYEGECGTTVVNFTNTGTQGLAYTWDIDGTIYNVENPTHDFGATGTYTVTLTVGDAICGTQDQITMDISVVDNPITYIFNSPTCYQFNDGSVTVNTQFNTGNEVCVITNTSGTQVNQSGSFSANNLPGGWYYIDVDLGGGCTAVDSVELINPGELLVDLFTFDPLCNGAATGIVEVDSVYNAQGNPSNVSFFWNPNPAGIGGVGADSSYNMTAGSYTLTVNDDNGCSNVIDFSLSEPPALVFSEIGADPAYCRSFEYQVGHGKVWAAAGGGTPDYDYVWVNLQDSTATANTTWGGLNPGDYQITVSDANGCLLTQTLTVDELDPIADFTMTSDEFIADWEGTAPVSVHFVNTSSQFANPNNPNADTTFFWNFNYDNSSWYITHDLYEEFDTTYTEGGTYEVCLVVVTANDCKDTTCKEIIVYDPLAFEPVNVFTPNSDGINDEFTFYYTSDAVKEFHCLVVDRWGTKIAEFNDIAETWDGTDSKGKKCADGVYFYTYEGEAENGEKFKGQGNVTLVSGK